MSIAQGTTVQFRIDGQRVWGTVQSDPTHGPTGVHYAVKLLPDFAHLAPTGWVNKAAEELTPTKVCACATLAYRPIWGDRKGELITTGCDFSRRPSRASKFLPGHDAKAKGFLIRASGYAQVMENGKGALETARELSDKISLAVAKGMDNARKKSASKPVRKAVRRAADPAPATREDELTETQRLHKELGVTEPMLKTLVRGALCDTPGYQGTVSGPTGTTLALQTRKLTSWDAITDLGYQACGLPTMAEEHPEWVVCTDELGSYSQHATRYNPDTFVRECKRCGAELEDD